MQAIVAADPFKCRAWALHERLGSEINADTCAAEIKSFTEHGQLIPVLGRMVIGDPHCEFELIYGARRLFVARHLRKPLLVEVRDLSDRDGLIAMDIENRLRRDISAYERGLGYARWLRAGHFTSQEEIASALGVSGSQVSRLLRLTRLPAVVVDAFRSAAEICESWGLEIMDALEAPARRAAVIRGARSLSRTTPRLAGENVHRKLLTSAVRGRKPQPKSHDRVVLGTQGAPLFRVRYQRNSIVMRLPATNLCASLLEQIEAVLLGVLQPQGPAALPQEIYLGKASSPVPRHEHERVPTCQL
jgi:ParB family chromosome partitioning protein